MTASPATNPITAVPSITTSVTINSEFEYSLHVSQLGKQGPPSSSRKKSIRQGRGSDVFGVTFAELSEKVSVHNGVNKKHGVCNTYS